jgi:hypothetical protein
MDTPAQATPAPAGARAAPRSGAFGPCGGMGGVVHRRVIAPGGGPTESWGGNGRCRCGRRANPVPRAEDGKRPRAGVRLSRPAAASGRPRALPVAGNLLARRKTSRSGSSSG